MLSIGGLLFFIIGYLMAFLGTYLINTKTGKITQIQDKLKVLTGFKKILIVVLIISVLSIALGFVKGILGIGLSNSAYIIDGILMGAFISLFMNFDYQK